MKKLLVLVAIAALSMVTVRAEPPRYRIEPRSIPEFKILMEDKDPVRESLPIIEYDGAGGYTFHKLEMYADERNHPQYRIALDAHGDPIAIQPGSPNFYNDVFNTFYHGNSKYFIGNNLIETISLSFFFPERRDDFNEKVSAGTFTFFDRKADRHHQTTLGGVNNSFRISEGFVCYIDNLYQIEWSRPIKDKWTVERREAINPDQCYFENSIPGLMTVLPMHYHSNLCLGKGYLTFAVDSRKYSVGGYQYEMAYPVEVQNGTFLIEFFDLVGLLDCQYTGGRIDKDNEKIYRYTASRLWGLNHKIDLLNLSIQAKSADYTINDEAKSFPIAPYIVTKRGWSIMAPLKEVCDALKAKVIYRPLDGTILVARYFGQ